jgi:hypothetical protein
VPVVLNEDQPFEVVVNKACASLPVEASVRQKLLAESSLIERHRMLSVYLDTVIETVATGRAGGVGGSSVPN